MLSAYKYRIKCRSIEIIVLYDNLFYFKYFELKYSWNVLKYRNQKRK